MPNLDNVKRALSLCPGNSVDCEQDRCPYWADKQCVSDMHMDAMEVIDNLEERIAIMSEGLPDV